MMQKRLQAVLLGLILAGFIAGWGCAEGAATAPLPPEVYWELAPGGAASEIIHPVDEKKTRTTKCQNPIRLPPRRHRPR